MRQSYLDDLLDARLLRLGGRTFDLRLEFLVRCRSGIAGAVSATQIQQRRLSRTDTCSALRSETEIRARLTRGCWYADEFDCVLRRSHWRTSSIPAPNVVSFTPNLVGRNFRWHTIPSPEISRRALGCLPRCGICVESQRVVSQRRIFEYNLPADHRHDGP